MKKSVYYIFISVAALLMMFFISLFSVIRIYNLEEERFNYQYREIISQGIGELESIKPGVTFSTAYLALENGSNQLLKTYYSIADTSLVQPFRRLSYNKIRDLLIREQGLEQVIHKLLEKRGIKTDFDLHLDISELTFFSSPDTLNIFDSDVNNLAEYDVDWQIPGAAIPVSRYSYEGSFFKIEFESYVDFINKKRIVMGQMLGLLVITGFAILMVAMVFTITLRNMLEEKRLSQLKTDFINNMTHELKTPLSTIAIATKTMGNPSVIEDKEKVASMAEMIGRQNQYLSKQINHLLEVSMWEKGQFDLDKKKFLLKPFLQAIVEAFRWECKGKVLSLIEDYDGIDGLEVFWDETQMTMAIHNILLNGFKYSNGDPVIHIRVKKENNLIIEIQDNGLGISKEQQKHIFDKFYRVHTGNIHKVKGLGLGLFYVKQIVEAHKGEVQVKSKKYSGSIFTLKIPYHG